MDNGHLLIEPIEPLCIGLIIAAALAGALYFIYHIIKSIKNK